MGKRDSERVTGKGGVGRRRTWCEQGDERACTYPCKCENKSKAFAKTRNRWALMPDSKNLFTVFSWFFSENLSVP